MPSVSTTVPSTTNRPTNTAATHTVRRGESLDTIARTNGTTVAALLRENPQIRNPNLIFPGQAIALPHSGAPSTGGSVTPSPTGPVVVPALVTPTPVSPMPVAPTDTFTPSAPVGTTTGSSSTLWKVAPSLDGVRAGTAKLERGQEGPAVKAMQELLTTQGFGVEATGRFGPTTETAVRSFQQARGLLVDGIAGKNTVRALETRPGDLPIVGYGDAYENGRKIGNVALTEINGKKVSLETAQAFNAMKAAAAASGVDLRIVSGFRTHAEQQRLYDGWRRRAPGFNPANQPGHSNHQNGRALDLNTTGTSRANGSGPVYKWLANNAAQFGFTRIASEHWHWEFRR